MTTEPIFRLNKAFGKYFMKSKRMWTGNQLGSANSSANSFVLLNSWRAWKIKCVSVTLGSIIKKTTFDKLYSKKEPHCLWKCIWDSNMVFGELFAQLALSMQLLVHFLLHIKHDYFVYLTAPKPGHWQQTLLYIYIYIYIYIHAYTYVYISIHTY